MTDLAGVAAPRPRRLSWRLRKPPEEAPQVSFPELVTAHLRWREALGGERGDLRDRDREYRSALAAFEAAHGPVISAYWCSDQESAVAITARRSRLLGRLRSSTVTFHRVSDWATRNQPDIAAELHRCDELAVKAAGVLSGLRRNICMQLVIASAAHLLSLVDARSRHESEAATQVALRRERQELERAEAYFRNASTRQAQMVYFGGMAVGAAALVGFGAGGWFNTDGPLFATLAAGAVGAVISVIQRIQSDHFSLEQQDNVGRPYLVFLGALRPIMGAVFGVVIYAALASDLVQVGGLEVSENTTLAVVLAFAAGFSERWATDTLAAAVPGVGGDSRRDGLPRPAEHAGVADPARQAVGVEPLEQELRRTP